MLLQWSTRFIWKQFNIADTAYFTQWNTELLVLNKTTPRRTFYSVLNNTNLIKYCPVFVTHKRILPYPISQLGFLSENCLLLTHRHKIPIENYFLSDTSFCFLWEIWPIFSVVPESFSCFLNSSSKTLAAFNDQAGSHWQGVS